MISHKVAVRYMLGLRSSEGLIEARGSTSTHMAGKLVLERRTQFTFTWAFPQDPLSVFMKWLLAFPRVRYLRDQDGTAMPCVI